jgi:transposase
MSPQDTISVTNSPPPSYDDLLALNAGLAVRLEQALARIAELEARLRLSSANSSKPPSSDGLAKPAPKSLRAKTGRGPGRPAGQPGSTLEQVADPDVIVRHVPAVCAQCGDDLAAAVEVGMARRQVFDVSDPKVVVTEHQIVTVACGCGHHTTASAPTEATAPAAYGPRLAAIGVYLRHGQFLSAGRTADALRDLFGAPVAPATVACWVNRTALGIIERVLPVIRDRIATAPVVVFDETGMRTDGRSAWLHSASTPTDVPLSVHPKRGVAAMQRLTGAMSFCVGRSSPLPRRSPSSRRTPAVPIGQSTLFRCRTMLWPRPTTDGPANRIATWPRRTAGSTTDGSAISETPRLRCTRRLPSWRPR